MAGLRRTENGFSMFASDAEEALYNLLQPAATAMTEHGRRNDAAYASVMRDFSSPVIRVWRTPVKDGVGERLYLELAPPGVTVMFEAARVAYRQKRSAQDLISANVGRFTDADVRLTRWGMDDPAGPFIIRWHPDHREPTLAQVRAFTGITPEMLPDHALTIRPGTVIAL